MSHYDIIEKLQNSTIQHGKENNRIYLMKLNINDMPAIINQLETLAKEKKYTKIFTKINASLSSEFNKHGYIKEAFIPKFFHGKEDVAFMVKFLSDERSKENNIDKIKEIINISQDKAKEKKEIAINNEFSMALAKPDNIEEMSQVYKKVFTTYPFPIHDKDYLLETMKNHIDYYCVFHDNKLVALSSSEKDDENKNVEMTDFATLPEYRGHSLSLLLLEHMEKEMKKQGHFTAYTIARSLSAGMNITFARSNYKFGGTLINNTNICGQLESMNIWYKEL